MRIETKARKLMQTTADYLLTIHSLHTEKGEVRKQDIAKALGVSHVTVLKAVERMKREGFVNNEAYRSIFLTEMGKAAIAELNQRFALTTKVLERLGIKESSAINNARRIVTLLSDDAIEAFAVTLK